MTLVAESRTPRADGDLIDQLGADGGSAPTVARGAVPPLRRMTSAVLVPVLRDKAIRSWPKFPTGGKADYLRLSVALERDSPTDAHFAAYSVPSIARRLARDALRQLEARAQLANGIAMVLVAFDVDCPAAHDGDPGAVGAWWLDETEKITALLARHPSGYVYRTRGGYRIVYLLVAPIVLLEDADAEAWSARYCSWIAYLAREFEIEADFACRDWTRLYRLPHATRDEGGRPERREAIGDAQSIGVWICEPTTEDIAAARRLHKKRIPKEGKEPRAPSGIPAGAGDGLLAHAFRARQWLGDEIEPGKWEAVCPNAAAHTKGESLNGSTVLYAPGSGEEAGWLHCSHAHCQGRTVRDVLACFSDEELAVARAAAGLPARVAAAQESAAADVGGGGAQPSDERARAANGSGPYTAEEIAAFAEKAGCSVEDFKHRWIVQQGTAFFIFAGGRYLRPLIKGELAASLQKRDLARVPGPQSPAGIEWFVAVGKNGVRLKSSDEIVRDYATVARKTVADLMLSEGRYDPITQTFFEAACPLRPIAPRFDAQIDQWLRLLGGKAWEKLLDWVATVTNLSRVSCAVYLHGPRDFGKNMFAEGLARLWGHSATELKSLIGNFNSALVNSPLVFADEEIPQEMTSGFLRSLVGSTTRALKRKFMPEAELLGSIRLVIAANNADLLKFDDEDFSVDDINAVAARILYIRPDLGTADFLRSLGGRKGTEGWVEKGDKIAAHALWLRDNRTVEPGSRFLVEGEIDTIHRRLATHGSIRGLAIEWICNAMLKTWLRRNPGIRFGDGKLYVNASFVKANWEAVLNDKRIPSLHKIGRALKPLARGEKRLALDDGRADFYDIDPEHIYAACRDLQIGTEEEYRGLVDGPLVDKNVEDFDA